MSRRRLHRLAGTTDAAGTPAGLLGDPVLGGSPVQGSAIAVTPAETTGATPVTSAFQWQTGPSDTGPWTDLTGETGTSTIAPASGQYLTVTQQASNAFGLSAVARAVALLIAPPAGIDSFGYGAAADAGETDDPANAPDWSSTTEYRPGDMVASGGLQYWAIITNTNVAPPNAGTWRQIVAVFYMNAVTGDDTYDGLSRTWTGGLNGPRRTIQGLAPKLAGSFAGQTIAPMGSVFLFERGVDQVFTGQVQINPRVGEDAGFLFGAVGTGIRPQLKWINDPAPFTVSRPLIWTNRADVKVRNLDLDGQYAELGIKQSGFEDSSAYGAMVNCNLHNVGGDGLLLLGNTGHYFYAANSTIELCGRGGHPGNGVAGGGTGVYLEHLSVIDCGIDAVLSHGIYLSVWDATTVRRCLITGSSTFGINSGAHGANPLIEENYLYGNPGGIDMSTSSGGSGEEFTGTVTIRKNKVFDTTIYAIYLNSLQAAVVENNMIARFQNYGIVVGHSSSLTDPGTSNVAIRHNTLRTNGAAPANMLQITGLLTGISVRNNILVATGASDRLFTIGNTPGPGTLDPAELTITNNLHYHPSVADGSAISWYGSNITLAAFQAAGNGTNTVTGDPLLVNTGTNIEDFNLQGGSPARNAGVNLSVAGDFNGTLRDATPHAGAFETA